MKAVTIDQLDIKEHVRWAHDQDALDVTFVTESQLIAAHPEIMGTSVIYPSKFDELFELQKKNLPWACFSAPIKFQTFSKRFFSYRLFPNIYWDDKEDTEEKEDDGTPSDNLIVEVLKVEKMGDQPSSLFEKDKTAILNMLESIRWVNELLKQISARKLQYQKG